MNQEFLDAVKESVQISQQKWVKWQHEMMGIIHCGSCLALHDCWFVFGNEPYLFDPHNFYKHGKNKAFESWGYSIADSKWLQEEIERQGRQQYLSGNYELGVLNLQGQRISIRVTIPRKNSTGNVSFITGWMVKPGGKIKLNTPYGGK